MNLRKALLVLTEYNKWRLGGPIEMLNPKLITEAIEVILKHHEKTNEKKA